MEEQAQRKKEEQERILTQESNLILTSDGIHDYLEAEAMEVALAAECDAETVCRNIARLARVNGSTDDISIIIVDRLEKYQE